MEAKVKLIGVHVLQMLAWEHTHNYSLNLQAHQSDIFVIKLYLKQK